MEFKTPSLRDLGDMLGVISALGSNKSRDQKLDRKSMGESTTGDSMEEAVHILPMLEDCVIGLGDLWDCRTNSCPGNIFEGPLAKENLEVFPMKDLTYKLNHFRTSAEKSESLDISASLSLDMALGEGKKDSLKLSGSADFSKSSTSSFLQEELMCIYKLNTYVVRIRPNSRDKVDPLMKDRLVSNPPQVKATHYVQSVRLGGQANASIKYQEAVSSEKMNIGGKFNAEIVMGEMTIKAEAELGILTDETNAQYSTEISVLARPRLQDSPVTVEEMFIQVKGLDEEINKEQHFLDTLGPEIVGVPLSFKLVPLSQLIDFKAEALYKIMEDELMTSFQSMVFTLQDFTMPDALKRLVRQRDARLSVILTDPVNPLTLIINGRETSLAGTARQLKKEAFILFGEYKEGHKTGADLSALVTKYNEEFNIIDIMNEVETYVQLGKSELAGIHSADVVPVGEVPMVVTFLTNEVQFNDWWGGERRIKLLLKTSPNERAVGGVFLKLYYLSGHLAKLDIDTAVVLPNVSNEFSLTIKIQGQEVVYREEDITFALDVLRLSIEQGEFMSTLFFNVNGSLNGLSLPLSSIEDVTSLVVIMKKFQGISICESYPQLLAGLLETSNSLNLVLPLQGLNTSVEMMRFFRQLRLELPANYPQVAHKWFVGKFDLNNIHDAPLLFVFKDDRLLAVCLDHLDILILMNELRRNPKDPDLSAISYRGLREYCFYHHRANFALGVLEGLVLDHETKLKDPVGPLPAFPEDERDETQTEILLDAIAITQVTAVRNELDTVNRVALNVIRTYDGLPFLLAKHGWTDTGFTAIPGATEWETLLKELQDFLADQAPYLVKVTTAIESLTALKAPDVDPAGLEAQIHKIIKFIVDFEDEDARPLSHASGYHFRGQLFNEEEILREVQEQIRSYEQADAKLKLRGILNALNTFYQAELKKESFFHLTQLILLVEALSAPTPTIKGQFVDLAKKYCAPLLIDDTKYPGAQKGLNEALTSRNLYKALDVLTSLRTNSKLFTLHKELFNLSSATNVEPMKTLVENMKALEFADEQLETMWQNGRFQYWMRQGLENEALLQTMYFYLCVGEEEESGEEVIRIPSFIPADFAERLKPLLYSMEEPSFEWKRCWSSVQDVVQTFQIILTQRTVPQEFALVLRDNVEHSVGLEAQMNAVNALFFWNSDKKYFSAPWGLHTLQVALDRLSSLPSQFNHASLKGLDIQVRPRPSAEEPGEGESPYLSVNEAWTGFTVGGLLHRITAPSLRNVREPSQRPLVDYDQLMYTTKVLLPYFVQKLKSSSTSPLHPNAMVSLIDYPPKGERPGFIDFGDGDKNKTPPFFLSKGDVLVALLTSAKPLVIHALLDSMARDNLVIPLALPAITSNPSPILLLPLLQNLVVKDLVGVASDPHLFSSTTRLVLTIRIGDKAGSPGRNTFLNTSLMSESSCFSSLAEMGGKNGPPISRKGLVEFTWLTKSTVQTSFWENVVKDHYDSGKPDMLLLGSLHGDAFEHPHYLQVLKSKVSAFVAFWRASNWSELSKKKKDLNLLIGNGPEVLELVIDPDSTIASHVNEQNLISFGNSLSSVATTQKLHAIFKTAFACKPKRLIGGQEALTPAKGELPLNSPKLVDIMMGCVPKASRIPNFKIPPFFSVDGLANQVSNEFLGFIKQKTVRRVKEAILEAAAGREPSDLFQSTVQYFLELLSFSPEELRDTGLTHFISELSLLSSASSANAQSRLLKVRSEIETRLGPVQDLSAPWVIELEDEAKAAKRALCTSTLTMADLFGAVNSVLEGLPKSLVSTYPESCFDYFNRGYPVQLLDKLSGGSKWADPMKRIFAKFAEGTRVFVVSTLGLQGSGKSTLLNRLFGQGFLAGEGEETKGLQMRMFRLEETLQTKLECDVMLVIDSEGLGAPENSTFRIVDKAERNLTAFLLGISNLVIVNVNGEKTTELFGIIEIALATTTRLKSANYRPKMAILQQRVPTEDQGLKSDRLDLSSDSPTNPIFEQFKQAISNVTTLTRKHEFDVGVLVRENRRLESLKSGVKHAESFFQVEDRETNAMQSARDIETFLEYILDSCAQTSRLLSTQEWLSHAMSHWEELQLVDSTNQFKDAAEAQAQFELNERVDVLLRSIDRSFRFHEKNLAAKFEVDLQQLFDPTDSRDEAPFTRASKLRAQDELVSDFESEKKRILQGLHAGLRRVINTCDLSADGGPCPNCIQAFQLRENLTAELATKRNAFQTVNLVQEYLVEVRESLWNKFRQMLVAREVSNGRSDELKSKLEELMNSQAEKGKKGPDETFLLFEQFISTKQFLIPAAVYIQAEASKCYSSLPFIAQEGSEGKVPDLESITAFDLGHYNEVLASAVTPRKSERLSWRQNDWLLARVEAIPSSLLKDNSSETYMVGMTREMRDAVTKLLLQFEVICGEKLDTSFQWAVHRLALTELIKQMEAAESTWNEENNPVTCLLQRWEDVSHDLGLLFSGSGPYREH